MYTCAQGLRQAISKFPRKTWKKQVVHERPTRLPLTRLLDAGQIQAGYVFLFSGLTLAQM